MIRTLLPTPFNRSQFDTKNNINKLRRANAKLIATLIILCSVFSYKNSYAYSFIPTEVEFLSWSSDCKNVYMAAKEGIDGVAGIYGFKLSHSEKKKWFNYGGNNGGLWHFCEGLIKIRRAEMEFRRFRKNDYYKEAIKDIQYGYKLIPRSNLWSAQMGVSLARVYRGLEEPKKAKKQLEDVLNHHPANAQAYVLMSMLYFDKKNYKTAQRYLLKGNTANKGASSEILYFLGFASLKMGKIADAKKYAQDAINLGYPLKGLIQKIEKFEKQNP